MIWEDLIPIVVTIAILLIISAKAILGASLFVGAIKAVAKDLIPVAAAEIARQGANAVFRPLSNYCLMPPNTTAISLL